MSVPIVFLSAASKDLEDWRNLLHATFENAGCKVLTQTISLGTATSDVLDLLKKNLDRSDYVLHIAGTAYGSEPQSPPFPSYPNFICSFTQFEYYYSRQTIDLKVIAFVCAESFPFKKFSEEGKDYKDRERRKQLQREHRFRLLNGDFDGTPVKGQPLSHSVEDVNSLLKQVAGAIGRIRSDAPTSLEKAKETLLSLAEKQHQELLELSKKRHNELKALLEQTYLEVESAASEFRESSRGLARQSIFGAAISILVLMLLCAVLIVLKPIQAFVAKDREEITSVENDFQRNKERIQQIYGERKKQLSTVKDALLRQELFERLSVEESEVIRALERQTQLMQRKPVNDPLSLYPSMLEISQSNIPEQEKIRKNRNLIDQTRPKRLELAKKDGMALLWPEHLAALGAFISNDVEGAEKYFSIFVEAQEDYPEALLDACFFYCFYYERNQINEREDPSRLASAAYDCAKRIEGKDFKVSSSANFANDAVALAYLCKAEEELKAGNLAFAVDLIESARPKLKIASNSDDQFTATVRYFAATELLVRAKFEDESSQEGVPSQSQRTLEQLILEEVGIGKSLVKRFDTEAESYRLLSQAYENLGNFSLRFSAAASTSRSPMECYQMSLSTLKNIPALYESAFRVQCDIAQANLTIGHFCMDYSYDLIRAQAAFDEAETIMSKQLAEAPDSAFARRLVAFALVRASDVRLLIMQKEVGGDLREMRLSISQEAVRDLKDIAQRAVTHTRELFVNSFDLSDLMQYEHTVAQLLTALWLSNDADGFNNAVDSFSRSLIQSKEEGKLDPNDTDMYLQKLPRTMDDFEKSDGFE